MSRQFFKLFLLLTALSLSSVSYAIPVNLSIEGTVNNTLGMNAFGLSAGDSVFANASFDDSLIASGAVELGTDGNAFGGTLTFTIGALTFTESDDVDFFDDIFPELAFDGGVFQGFDFVSDLFNSGGLNFTGIDAGIENVTGTWNIDTLSITPTASVPEPSSMMLLGLGLVGLIGAKRKLS